MLGFDKSIVLCADCGRSGGNESPAPDSAVEDPLANQTGEGFVDGYDGDAVGDGQLAVGLELGPDGHLAVEDLAADVASDLLVERGRGAGIYAQATAGKG